MYASDICAKSCLFGRKRKRWFSLSHLLLNQCWPNPGAQVRRLATHQRLPHAHRCTARFLWISSASDSESPRLLSRCQVRISSSDGSTRYESTEVLKSCYADFIRAMEDDSSIDFRPFAWDWRCPVAEAAAKVQNWRCAISSLASSPDVLPPALCQVHAVVIHASSVLTRPNISCFVTSVRVVHGQPVP